MISSSADSLSARSLRLPAVNCSIESRRRLAAELRVVMTCSSVSSLSLVPPAIWRFFISAFRPRRTVRVKLSLAFMATIRSASSFFIRLILGSLLVVA